MGVAGRAIGCYWASRCISRNQRRLGGVGRAARDEMANCKTNGHENVLSVRREEAQEQENGRDEGPPWVWRCPAARRGEVRRLREAGRVKEPSRWSSTSTRISSYDKGRKPEKI